MFPFAVSSSLVALVVAVVGCFSVFVKLPQARHKTCLSPLTFAVTPHIYLFLSIRLALVILLAHNHFTSLSSAVFSGCCHLVHRPHDSPYS
jgi:zinc transporter ZupT